MNIILCGYNWVGCKALSDLIKKNHNIFVYTHKSPPHINNLIETCEKFKINYSLEKISKHNLPFKPDLICSIYYRYIIGKDIIEHVNGKIFNLHPSLLPEYKGCSSLTWSIINGEKLTGFTYHYIDEKVDTGNIIFQKAMTIEEWDTQATLYHRVMFEAAKYFLKVLGLVEKGYVGHKQSKGGKYYKRGCPFDGIISDDWDE